MKRLALTLASVIAVACSAPRTEIVPGWYGSVDATCPIVTVENHNFADVTVYFTPRQRRLGTVNGYQTEDFKLCGSVGQPSRFRLDAIGDAINQTVEGATRIDVGSHVLVRIGHTAGHSFVAVGSGFQGGDDLLSIVNAVRLVPSKIHLAIYDQVTACSGLNLPIDPAVDLYWFVADSITNVVNGERYYGATIMDLMERPMIVFEKGYWFHPTVISHEILHVLGAEEGDDFMRSCQIPVAGSLLGRTVPGQ
jgi:hypothetical protein